MYTKEQIIRILDEKIVASIPFLYNEYRYPIKIKKYYKNLISELLAILDNQDLKLLNSPNNNFNEKNLSDNVIYPDQKYIDYIKEGLNNLLEKVNEIDIFNLQESYYTYLKGQIMSEIYIFLNIYVKEIKNS